MNQLSFYDRSSETRALQDAWRRDRPVFFTLAGRRRVGKSRLLSHFLDPHAHVYLSGTKQTARSQLADASRELYRVTADPVLAHQDFDSWDALLAFVGARAQDHRFGFVLDEFSYYCDETPGLPSMLQRWWDRIGQHGRIFFVLADSHLAFMDRLLQGDQPLFGRRTHELHLAPFDYADAARFFPGYSGVDRMRAYGIFGGMPAYLAVCDPSRPLRDNILDATLTGGAPLRQEPDYLLTQERSIKDPVGYRSVLRAIAEQHTQPNDIAQAAGYRSPADITGILARLQELALVARIAPITARAGGRISRYILTDNFLAFWFRFLQPAEGLLDRGMGSLILEDLIKDQMLTLDLFISRAQGPWEQACMAYLWRAQRAQLLGGTRFDSLGCWWQGRAAVEGAEIDIVGLRRGRTILLGSCKWRRPFVKLGDLHELRVLGSQPGAGPDARYVLFSRSGFDRNLISVAKEEGVLLVDLQAMFQPAVVDG